MIVPINALFVGLEAVVGNNAARVTGPCHNADAQRSSQKPLSTCGITSTVRRAVTASAAVASAAVASAAVLNDRGTASARFFALPKALAADCQP